jgi:hypothetical protein
MRRVYETNRKGTFYQVDDTKKVVKGSIDYRYRSEYIVEYDAMDAAGNKADQVVFAVILKDTTKPTFDDFNRAQWHSECKFGKRTTIPMPKVSDNIDRAGAIEQTLRINGKTSLTENIQHTRHTYTHKYTIRDFAGVFGKNGKNNHATRRYKFTVSDTQKPKLDAVKDVTFECSKSGKYTTPSSTCRDGCDGTKKVGTSVTSVSKTFKRTYNLKYTCTDGAGLQDSKKQIVTIKDTTPPTIDFKMSYVLQYSAKTAHKGFKRSIDHKNGYLHLGGHPDTSIAKNQMNAFSCDDLCTGSCDTKKKLKRTHKWVKKCGSDETGLFNTLIPGTYYHKFTCTDCNSLKTSICRTVINEDAHKPILKILGDGAADHLKIEATHDENYVDAGATCYDHVDKWISDKVEVSGDVVKLSQPGKYIITYKCQDMAGNKADPLLRTITVQDTTCPTCKMIGKDVKREASFTYKDDGAKCTDTLDGTKTVRAVSTVNTEATGCYTVVYSATDQAGNTNMKKKGGASCDVKRTVRNICVRDTLKPVIALHFNGEKIHESDASDRGLNNQANPAANKWMAEASSVNGWIIGAVASAVAGIALLAMGGKTTQVSVPV